MSNKDTLISDYNDYIKAMKECVKAERWQEASESCKGGIKALGYLLPLATSSEEKNKYTANLKSLKKLYAEITKRNSQRSTLPKNVDDVDPLGVKYVQRGIDVRDFLREYNDDSITLDDVCGMEREKKIISEIWTRKENEEFNKLIGYNPPKFYFFYGVPGVGKTFLSSAALTEVKRRFDGKIPVYTLYIGSVWDHKKGTAAKNISAIWDFIKEHDDFVLFIDDIDQIAYDRMNTTFEQNVAVTTFIAMLADLRSLPGKIIIGATCKPYKVDCGLIPRADAIVEFYLPDNKTAYAMLEKEIGKKIAPDVDLHSVADRLVETKCTHHGIKCFSEFIIDQLAVELIRDGKQGITRGFDEYLITNAMIEKAFSNGAISMDEETLIRIDKFRNNF